jgi:hypothetical protein
MFLLDSLKTLTILNVVPETASEFCPGFSSLPLVVSVFAFLQLLVDFFQCTHNSLRNRVSEEGY